MDRDDVLSAVTTLDRAIEIIQQGWCQTFLKIVDGTYHYCIGAAVSIAEQDTRFNPRRVSVRPIIEAYLKAHHDTNSLVRFNDTVGRTQANILEVFNNIKQALEPQNDLS